MEQQPQFIKEFSKEESPEDRQQAARAIRATRAEHFAEKKTDADRRTALEQEMGGRTERIDEQLQAIENLKREIEELATSRGKEIFYYFQLRKLRADVAVGEKSLEELRKVQTEADAEFGQVSDKLDSKDISPSLRKAKALLDGFYDGQKKKWAGSDYEKEDIEKYFSEEHLASLSLEDYALLLKRFPEEMVAHVTRQGIRDHVGMVYHNAGAGAYSDGFMKIAEDGRLRSPLGVYLAEGAKEEAVANFLQLEKYPTKQEALAHFEFFTDPERQGAPGTYVDRMAVHFAAEEVADFYYGSETSNEIFIAYPSAYVASQYYFHGQLNERGGGYWNDQWVWANEERGMDLNAGLVFIPKDTKVDRNTGSRYELDEDKNPVFNQEAIASVQGVIDSPDFYDFVTGAEAVLGKMNQDWTDQYIYPHNRQGREEVEPMRLQLEQRFGITDLRIQRSILDYTFLSGLRIRKQGMESGKDEESFGAVEDFVKASLQKYGLLYRESGDAVAAEEYWKKYFTAHPEQRPSKIVYYEESDPTKALYAWRESKGLIKEAKDKNIGFEEKNVPQKSPQAIAGMDRFKGIARKVIDDYFQNKGEEHVGSE